MAIQVRRGNKDDLDITKAVAGEPLAPLDTKELYVAFSAGDVKKIATYEDMVNNIRDAESDIIEELTIGINTAITECEAATQNTIETNTSASNAETLRIIAENKREDNITGEAYRKANEVTRQEFYDAYKVCEPHKMNKQYVIGNHVTCNGSTYQAQIDNIDYLPPTNGDSTWLLISQKGDQGIQGEQGIQGIQGNTGDDGTSPTVTVATNTSTEYKLNVTDINGTITTPNLKGANGTGIGDMTVTVYDPNNKATDIFNSGNIVYDNTTSGLSATNVKEAIDEIKSNSGGSITFNSVALMKADTSLAIGDYVTTIGYYSMNDGGGANYVIVASSTGTDDGGSYITLNNTLQAKMIIENETVNVKQFGAKGDGTTDDITSFNNAMNIGRTVFIPEATYNFSTALTITSSNKVNTLIGVGDAKSALKFTGTDGIVANKSGLNIENLFFYGNSTGKGLKVLNSVNVKNCDIYTFAGGIALNNEVHVITSNFERSRISLCPEYGIHVKSGGNYQNNGITFKELYIVKCGTDGDNLTSNATIGSGDGFIIDGGYAITVENCVFEYNTGIGLKLVSNNYPLYGVSIINPYYERNKYANCYIQKGTYDISNLTIIGDFYTEAGNTPVANALSERKLYVANKNAFLSTSNGNILGDYGFIARNMNLRINNFMNSFPINFMDDLESTYPSNIVTYNDQKCFTITNSIDGAMLYSELAYIDPYYDYVISYELKKVNSTVSPNLLFTVFNADTDATLANLTGNLSSASSFDWTTFSNTISNLGVSVKKLRIYINIEGTKPADCEVYVRNIRITPILKHNGNTVINTTGNAIGDNRFSTSLNKPVWWDGSQWRDATGAVVTP